MLPYRTRKPAPLSRNRVLLVAGRSDTLVPVHEVELLEERLREAGADVTLNWQPAGHGLGQGDVEAARRWL
jgi:predicted esterase